MSPGMALAIYVCIALVGAACPSVSAVTISRADARCSKQFGGQRSGWLQGTTAEPLRSQVAPFGWSRNRSFDFADVDSFPLP
jgi:hypothetical protein